MKTVGEQMVAALSARGVEVVFGIPGVHTIELYRGLASSQIRHVTPRHEQGAGFMADGYARVSGKPGVALVITGPGVTNTLTAMAQARADSIPMVVISGVNTRASLGKGLGYLHELPDQWGMVKTVALASHHVDDVDALSPSIDAAFMPFSTGRSGPTHVQIPLDLAGHAAPDPMVVPSEKYPCATAHDIETATNLINEAQSVVILAGGGAKFAATGIKALAERLNAPVVMTVNGRGILHDHRLAVPASPSLASVRDLINQADLIVALGTELGPTDYDMYATGTMPDLSHMIRVDICRDQLGRHDATLGICSDVGTFVEQIIHHLPDRTTRSVGPSDAAHTRAAAWDEIGSNYRRQVAILNALRDHVPNAIMVGDSTQAVYAGNLYYDHDRPAGWFNAATGFGALGYGIPASIGAAIAAPQTRVICHLGDGGAQFSLTDVMAAVDERLPILFIIWNNRGYGEIATSMIEANVTPVGCDPSPPDFQHFAAACGVPYMCAAETVDDVIAALKECPTDRPAMLEIKMSPKD